MTWKTIKIANLSFYPPDERWTLYRGLSLDLDEGVELTPENFLQHINPRGHVHWSEDFDTAKQFGSEVVLQGEVWPGHAMDDYEANMLIDPDFTGDENCTTCGKDYDSHTEQTDHEYEEYAPLIGIQYNEAEVPIRPGKPITITGIHLPSTDSSGKKSWTFHPVNHQITASIN